MDKLLTDIHTHSKFSHDGIDTLQDMLAAAAQKGLCFYGVSEHYDYDVYVKTGSRTWTDANAEEYFHTARHLQEDYAGVLNVLIGYEYGYTDDEQGMQEYVGVTEKYKPDFVVNSVHTCHGLGYCGGAVFYTKDGKLRNKDEVYFEYLSLLRQCLDVPYTYDIVGHIGYATRYAPYEDKSLSLQKYGAQIDDILRTVIKKDKILEVNASNKGGTEPFLPQRDILKRYFQLGGRKISYASDAHGVSRIAEHRAMIVEMLKEIGFTYITVPCRGEHIKVEI